VSKRANQTAFVLGLLLVTAAFAVAACGGDDKPADRTSASQTQTGPDGTGKSHGQKRDDGSSGSASAGDQNGGGLSGTDRSGGADAPQVDRPLRRRSLGRYLAERYRVTEWYGAIRKLRITGSQVRVYMSLDPESDDEGPPVIACRAVRSYSTRIEKVTVYGTTMKLVPTKVLREC
jgi:hypothetical protein